MDRNQLMEIHYGGCAISKAERNEAMLWEKPVKAGEPGKITPQVAREKIANGADPNDFAYHIPMWTGLCSCCSQKITSATGATYGSPSSPMFSPSSGERASGVRYTEASGYSGWARDWLNHLNQLEYQARQQEEQERRDTVAPINWFVEILKKKIDCECFYGSYSKADHNFPIEPIDDWRVQHSYLRVFPAHWKEGCYFCIHLTKLYDSNEEDVENFVEQCLREEPLEAAE